MGLEPTTPPCKSAGQSPTTHPPQVNLPQPLPDLHSLDCDGGSSQSR